MDLSWNTVQTTRSSNWIPYVDPKSIAMGTQNLSASARNHEPDDGYTNQLPQYSPSFETPTLLQRRKIRIPVSPSKSSSKARDPGRLPWNRETPDEDNSHSMHCSEALAMTDSRDHAPSSAANMSEALAANRTQSLIGSPGHRTTAHDTYPGDESLDHGDREVIDEHRLEAAATLACLLGSRFFENAKTLKEQISLLATLWTSIREENLHITTVPGSVEETKTPAQNEKTRLKSESTAALQSLDKKQESNSTRKSLINGNDRAPKTPDSHDLKRQGSNLTSQFNNGVSRPPDTAAVTSEQYRLSLGIPPPFNLDTSKEQLSHFPTEPRRTKPRVCQIAAESDLRPAKFAAPNIASESLNFSITDDPRAISSVEVQDPPSYIQGSKNDEKDDLYHPFTISDDDAMSLTRDGVLPAGEPYARVSHSVLWAEEASTQDSKESLYHTHRSTIRKLAPYTKRPPKSLAPESIIRDAIIKRLTKLEMGIAWRETSSGKWIQQKSHTGWIYIYQIPNEVNTVKIGVTQASIETRLNSWTEQCGHQTQLVYPSEISEREPVPYIFRLEALVQAELAASRLEVLDCSCGKRHMEWFEETVEHARKVVVKWSDWMRINPYKEVEPQHWELLPRHIPHLAELSRPSPRHRAEGCASAPIWV